ncbi:MAG: glycosyltransferase [Planctomycetia bacterium]|nr:glycosyltransferase [Planctomycetia bacterium]
MSVSVVVPICNEEDNVAECYRRLKEVLVRLGQRWEILFVDDGSRDGSSERLHAMAAYDPRVKIIEFRRNFGQTAAMRAGMEMATGDVIITIDGDLQNEPGDIPMMLDKLDEGFDLVHGWRKDRQDALVNRKIPSKIANWLISRVTGFPVHDLGCTLKVMRREVADDLSMYGEMHRFIPILAHWQGANCAEVVTRHHPRQYGATKYGIWRTFRVLMDLITVKYLIQYAVSPMKCFGGIGMFCGLVGAVSGTATLAMRVFDGTHMIRNPLLLLTVFAWTVAVQFVALGLLGELCARIYHECQGKRPYRIRRLVNFEDESQTHELHEGERRQGLRIARAG